MSPFRKVGHGLTRQSVSRIGRFRVCSGNVSAKTAFIIVGTTIAVYSAAIAASVAGAKGSPDAGLSNVRNAVVVHFLDNETSLRGGLTIKEKTHPGCGAGSFRSTHEDLDAAGPGEKGDRLAASACEWSLPVE